MTEIFSSISCNLDENILSAALPLFEAEKIEAIEWSFDTLYKTKNIPGWFTELLKIFGDGHRLTGHGVYFSLFSGKWSQHQQDWLNHLQRVCASFHFDHISEHFGFMTGKNFHQGAPLPIPFTSTTLAIGHDRLKRISQACQRPVGLENLAFSYSLDDVKRQGEFLEKLMEPINGFIILDLHNIYCQSHNFNIDPDKLIQCYPLWRVREMHVSGGSWEDSGVTPGKKIRRDTHDDKVPKEVFALLTANMPGCPNLKYVVLEQLSDALSNEDSRESFRNDFNEMDKIVHGNNNFWQTMKPGDFLPAMVSILQKPVEDDLLYIRQKALSDILETAISIEQAAQLLRSSVLSHSDWETETWEPAMLETAIAIAQKWKDGFA